MSRTTASLVCYRSQFDELVAIVTILRDDPSISAFVIVDNGAAELPAEGQKIRALVESNGGLYVAPPSNVGFGSGHNAGLAALKHIPSDFHLMVNPDVIFSQDVIPELSRVMLTHPRTGLLMPRILYPDRSTQYLCKLLPTPVDFALRRFAPGPLKPLVQHQLDRYELRAMDFEQAAQIPFLSGCFMFTRRNILESIGGFDERYFLYMEDVDLCRRMSRIADLVYWPAVSVSHRHERGSHNSWKLALTHIRSSITYFNHWGWFFDKERDDINQTALTRLTSHRS